MKPVILIIIFLIISSLRGFSQNDPCHKTTEGKDFWFGFMENRSWQHPEKNSLSVTVTSRFESTFTISTGQSENIIGTYSISAYNSRQVFLDWNALQAFGTQNIEDKGIHITSTQPVNVYAYNYAVNSSDVAVIYPKESLGTEYYTMCYEPHVHENGRNSEFLVVAVENNTTIHITPTKIIDGPSKLPPGVPYDIKLNKGQVYQAQSENVEGAPGEGDLTGTHLWSEKPFALFSGVLATTVPADLSVQAWDQLYEQMPPVQSWGREFYTSPLKGRGQDRYRILAAEDGTIVNVENIGDIYLSKGQFNEFVLNYNQPSRIQSNKKILVAQYSQSRSVDPDYNKGDGDPFMIILSPVEQTVNDVTFVAYQSDNIKKTYVNVISRTDQISTLLMDESPAFRTSFIPYKNGLYSYAQIEVPKGITHRIRNTESTKGFLATVYGFGGVESFGYGVGFNLDIRADLGADTIINGRKTRILCFGTDSITLRTGYGFDSYLWSTNAATDTIRAAEAKTYWVTASLGECTVSDTVELLINKPIVKLGNDTLICNPDTIPLDAGFGWKNILWSPGNETTQVIYPKKSGTYSVQATNRTGCTASGSIKLTFDDRPKLNLSFLDTLYCGTKSAMLGISADKGGYTLERLTDGYTVNTTNAVVPVYGTWPFKFTATDSNGCASDSSFSLGFHKIPAVSFSIDSTSCYHYNLAVNYIGDAAINASRFTWIFGGDTIADGIGVDSDTIPLGVNQNKRDLSLKVTEQGCSNSDTIRDIKVIPDLTVQVIDSMGCQPFNAEFIAVNSETVTYDWDFGDGNSERLDNHPFHTYNDAGYYNVNLKVTTQQGCSNEYAEDSLVHVAPIPTAGFTLNPDECLNPGNHVISYMGSGDQMDTYNWDLSAFDSVEVVQNPGFTQGPFVFNLKNKPEALINLSVVSQFGCMSDTAEITVKRIPDFSMKVYNNKGCIPLETSFEGVINDPVDQLFFTWDFGDGTTDYGGYTTHFYRISDQKYDISIIARSGLTGCSDTMKIDTLVFAYPKPEAGFSLDHSIVYNDKPDIQFLNQSAGATDYLWNFGDGTTSTEENPLHRYQSMGYQNALLQAYNDYNCMDSISHQVLVAFAKIFPPNAFSPNAPNPVDREFRLGQEAIKEEGYHLVIFSRWNDIVFEAKSEIKGWNGRMKNGNYAPAGNYVWVLDFTDFLGRSHRQTGRVTLIY